MTGGRRRTEVREISTMTASIGRLQELKPAKPLGLLFVSQNYRQAGRQAAVSTQHPRVHGRTTAATTSNFSVVRRSTDQVDQAEADAGLNHARAAAAAAVDCLLLAMSAGLHCQHQQRRTVFTDAPFQVSR